MWKIGLIGVLLSTGAHAGCTVRYENAATVQAVDSSAVSVTAIALGPVAGLVAGGMQTANNSEREIQVARFISSLSSDRLETAYPTLVKEGSTASVPLSGCTMTIKLVGAGATFSYAATLLEHHYEVVVTRDGTTSSSSVTLGEAIKEVPFPTRPREKLVMKNNKYVDETPPMPTQAEAEATFTTGYLEALDKIARRLAKKYPV